MEPLNTNIAEIIFRIQDKKAELRKFREEFKDILLADPKYAEMSEKVKGLRDNMKYVEDQAEAQHPQLVGEMDVLRADIKDNTQLLSDLAMKLYSEGKNIEITDRQTKTTYQPKFKVTYSKQRTLF